MLNIDNIKWDGRVAKDGDTIVAEWNKIDKELVLSHHWKVPDRTIRFVPTLEDAIKRLDVLKTTQQTEA